MNKKTIYILMCIALGILLLLSVSVEIWFFFLCITVFGIYLFLFWKLKTKTAVIVFGILLISFSIFFVLQREYIGDGSDMTSDTTQSSEYICSDVFENDLPKNWKVNTPQAKSYESSGATLTQICELNMDNNFEISVSTVKNADIDTYVQAHIKKQGTTSVVSVDQDVTFADGTIGRYMIITKDVQGIKDGVKREMQLLFLYDDHYVSLFYPVRDAQNIDDNKILDDILTLKVNNL